MLAFIPGSHTVSELDLRTGTFVRKWDVPAQPEAVNVTPDGTEVWVGSNSTGKVSYGTEGGYYQNAGIATIICGPGHIAQAHQPDEWVAQSELDACDAFIRRLADRLLT